MTDIDIYSIKPKFFFNKQETIHSKLGRVLTILTIIFSLLISIPIFKDFLESKIFTVSFTQDSNLEFELDLNEDPNYFGLTSSNSSLYTDWNKIYNLSISLMKKRRLDNLMVATEKKLLGIEKCSENQEVMETTDVLYDKIKVIPSWCLVSPDNNLTIFGEKTNLYDSSQIKIDVSKCQNSTENNFTCFSKEKIDSILGSARFFWGRVSYDLEHNLKDPFMPKPFMNIHSFNIKYITRLFAQFSKVTYYSDQGWIYKSLSTYTKPSLDNYVLIEQELTSNTFFSLSIETSGKIEIHYRKYQKLQEALAQTSVMFNIIYLFFSMIVGLIGDKIYFENFINYMSSSKEPKNKEKFNVFMQKKEKLFENLKEEKHENTQNYDRFDKKTKLDDNTIPEELKDKNIVQVSQCYLKTINKDSNYQDNKNILENSSFRYLNDKDKINQITILKNKKLQEIISIRNERREDVKKSVINASSIENQSINGERKIEDAVIIKEVEKKNSVFGVKFFDFIFSKYSKKRNSSMEKLENFINILKEFLSIEFIVKEINDVLDIKKILESHMIYKN